MQSTEFDEPTNLTDRQIFHLLSHGQKTQAEIVRLLLPTRFTDESIRRRVRALSDNYPWAVEVDEEATYYYRKDIGRQPILEEPPADYTEIEELLTDAEIKLGIKSRDELPNARINSSTLPNIFQEFLAKANRHSQILNTTEHLIRFFNIFDKFVIQTEDGYSSEGAPPNYPISTYVNFYLVVAKQHEDWKNTQAHEEFDKYLQKRLSDLVKLLEFVPPDIGFTILRILSLANISKSREGFKNIVRSNRYSSELLSQCAKICYIYSNDTRKLIDDLDYLKNKSDNDEVVNKIKEIKAILRDPIDESEME